MLNFGASKPRVKGGPGPRPPLDLRLNAVRFRYFRNLTSLRFWTV